VLISDVAETLGFDMPPMPEAAQARLRGFVPFCAPRNPVDCTAQAFNQIELVGEFARSMAADGGYSACLASSPRSAAPGPWRRRCGRR
jgi:acyl-CoA synthetase (NDP forming)